MSKKHTHTHQEKDDIRKDKKGFVSTKISDTPSLFHQPLLFLWEKSETPFLGKLQKKSNLPFIKGGGGGSNDASTQVVVLHHPVKKTSLAWL